jgi:hypothetical protein
MESDNGSSAHGLLTTKQRRDKREATLSSPLLLTLLTSVQANESSKFHILDKAREVENPAFWVKTALHFGTDLVSFVDTN